MHDILLFKFYLIQGLNNKLNFLGLELFIQEIILSNFKFQLSSTVQGSLNSAKNRSYYYRPLYNI